MNHGSMLMAGSSALLQIQI